MAAYMIPQGSQLFNEKLRKPIKRSSISTCRCKTSYLDFSSFPHTNRFSTKPQKPNWIHITQIWVEVGHQKCWLRVWTFEGYQLEANSTDLQKYDAVGSLKSSSCFMRIEWPDLYIIRSDRHKNFQKILSQIVLLNFYLEWKHIWQHCIAIERVRPRL